MQTPENVMTNEERFIEIEIKLTQQEDTVESLNQIIYRQQKKIDQLEFLVAELARRVSNMPDFIQNSANEKPPHY
jgi:SlyX protein